MNILYIISSLRHGGAEKQTIIDANYFSAFHNVFLVTFKDGELKNLLNNNVKLFVIGKKGYRNTAKKIIEIIEKENIKIINASLFASMIIAVLSAKKLNIPVFWYFHSHEYDVKLKSRIAFNYFSKKECLRKIFFVSTELKDSILNKGIKFPINKQIILYNSHTVDLTLNQKKIKDKEKIIIGYIGRLVELKRVEYLIELARYLKENKINKFEIIIIGDGMSKQRLVDYSKDSGVDDYIIFEGFRPNVNSYYDNFDIFVLPSREECLSLALIDAGIKSLPSVAFDVGGNNEIIIEDRTGYLVNSKEEFFEKIKFLINNGTKRVEMGNEARKLCIDKFDSAKRYEFLENTFKNTN